MKYLLLVLVIITLSFAVESEECEEATIKSTRIHWQYVSREGNVTLRDSYNARDYMRKVCNLKQ